MSGPAGPVKRSVTLSGHSTSLTLEAAFWDALAILAQEQGISHAALIGRIDAARGAEGLSSAVRVYILKAFQAKVGSNGGME